MLEIEERLIKLLSEVRTQEHAVSGILLTNKKRGGEIPLKLDRDIVEGLLKHDEECRLLYNFLKNKEYHITNLAFLFFAVKVRGVTPIRELLCFIITYMVKENPDEVIDLTTLRIKYDKKVISLDSLVEIRSKFDAAEWGVLTRKLYE